MAHLAQPRPGHAGADAGVVHQHDARVAHADPLVGGLHQLSAWRADAAGTVGGAVFGGIAHVEHIERAVGIVLEAGEVDGADHADAGFLRERLRALQRCRRGLRRAGREPVGAAAIAAEAGELPAHRAVAQRHHLVRDAGAAQALGAHDAARPAGAVHHHQRLRIRHEVADAVDQFAAGNADPGGDRHAHELLVRAAVEHHDVAAGIDPRLQVRRIDALGAVVVLHPLAERLRGHVDAGEQFVPGRRPGLGAAVQHGDIVAADALQPGGKLLGNASAIVDAADAHAETRQQRAGADLALRQRTGHGPEQMRGAELAILARVEQREFVAIEQPGMQRLCVDAFHDGPPRTT